jgi:iron complex outermembrane receptor protein
MKRGNAIVALLVWLGCSTVTQAAETANASASIEGRVYNVSTGEYLDKARLTVVGTSLEVFSGPAGEFRLSPVPAGDVAVRIFYTGTAPLTETVSVAAGETVQRDFNLRPIKEGGVLDKDGKEVVKLDTFTVTTASEMDGAAVAINEQRFAPNVTNVVAANEFGISADGSVAEFMKYLPGISINYVGGTANTISIDGAPANNVPITVGGFDLASTSSASTSRSVELLQLSIKNLSRLELLQSPTPESPGAALAGSINLVPTSAADYKHAVLDVSAFIIMRDNYRDFKKTPSPFRDKTYKVQPGFDLLYIKPVNKRFGFTLAASYSNQFLPQDTMQAAWRGAGFATNGTTLPDTTIDQPYLSDYTLTDARKFNERKSFSVTADYKLTAKDKFFFSYEYGTFSSEFTNNVLAFNVTNISPGAFSPTFTHGNVGGQLTMTSSGRWRGGETHMPTLTYRHAGPIWTAEAGIGYSRSTNVLKDSERGYFGNVTARRTNVAISFDDINATGPGQVTVKDGTTGAVVDPYKLSSYVLNAVANPQPRDSVDVKKTAYLNLARKFEVFGVPVKLKGGLDVRQAMRDIRGTSTTASFVGADGRATTTPTVATGSDDGAGGFVDNSFAAHGSPYRFPAIEWPNLETIYALYGAHPEYFIFDENAAYRNAVSFSKQAEETVSAGFIRADVSLFKNRLKLVGGLRVEQTNIDAVGALTDPTRNFQRDASGKVILGSNGSPLLIVPTSNALGVSQLTFIERGARAEKEYLRYFPSINASYAFAENWVVRASHYSSVGRPDYIQYTGGLTLPNTELPPPASGRIVVNNAGIKAWSAETTKLRLEYYFKGVGQVSIGGFRRDFKNFFGSTITPATPEFLALYNLDPNVYSPYEVSTQFNLPNPVRMTGLDFNYKQALTFLPNQMRGVQVFANATFLHVSGADAATTSLIGYVPRTYNWGISLTRPKYVLRAGWNFSGERKISALQTGRGIEASTYQWNPGGIKVDVQAEYYFWKKMAVFANFRNITDTTEDIEIYGPNTPDYARLRQRDDFGASWTFGIKGRF